MVIPPSRMELAFSFRVEKVLEISSCIVLGHQVINAQIYEYSFSGPVYKDSTAAAKGNLPCSGSGNPTTRRNLYTQARMIMIQYTLETEN